MIWCSLLNCTIQSQTQRSDHRSVFVERQHRGASLPCINFPRQRPSSLSESYLNTMSLIIKVRLVSGRLMPARKTYIGFFFQILLSFDLSLFFQREGSRVRILQVSHRRMPVLNTSRDIRNLESGVVSIFFLCSPLA